MNLIKWFSADPERTRRVIIRAGLGLGYVLVFWLGLAIGGAGQPAPDITAAATTTATTTTEPAPGQDPAVELPAIDAVSDVAIPFTDAWLKAANYTKTDAWLDTMKPYISESMATKLKVTDRATVPVADGGALLKVTMAKAVESVGDAAQIDVVLSDKTRITLTVKDTQDGTLVTDLKKG